jgi:hypothetical protein
MLSPAIIKPLDILEQVFFHFLPRFMNFILNPLSLQASEEPFHDRITPAIALVTRTAYHTDIRKNFLIALGGILGCPGRRCRITICKIGARPDPNAKVLTDDLSSVNWLQKQETKNYTLFLVYEWTGYYA